MTEREIQLSDQTWYLRRTLPLIDKGRILGVILTFTDISRPKRTEKALTRSNRGLALLNTCSEYLVRAQSEQTLLDDICRLIVDSGEYRMAWVGYAQNDADKTVKPVAQHGFEQGYLETMRFTWSADLPSGRGPIGISIRTGQSTAFNDLRNNTNFGPWRASATKLGFASSLGLPLSDGDNVFGCLALYAARPFAFDGDELHLLENLANDLAYGITALRERQRRAEAEAQLRAARDDLERRVAERTAELQQVAREAEAANRAKSDFLSAMSHELRTPLNAILGFSQMLLFDRRNPLQESQIESVQNIVSGGEHLLHLVNRILELESARQGEVDLVLETLRPTSILEECLSMARVIAEPRRISVTNATPLEDLPAVRVDVARLRQVLLNLLSNAVKFNREKGNVILSWSAGDNRMLRICVDDDGPGISDHLTRQLFVPFSRLEAKKANVDGTGIGLAISKQLVEAMGGAIGHEARPGGGSRFWFEVPMTG